MWLLPLDSADSEHKTHPNDVSLPERATWCNTPPQLPFSCYRDEGKRMRTISYVSSVAAAAILVAGTAIGITITTSHGSASGVAAAQTASSTTSTSSTTSVASSPLWAAEGKRLELAVSESNEPTYNKAYEDGKWAYESSPVNVTGNGPYTLNFGPLATTFNYPTVPRAIAYDWPPDSRFSAVADSINTVTIDGKRYLQVDVTISNFSVAYRAYTAWIY